MSQKEFFCILTYWLTRRDNPSQSTVKRNKEIPQQSTVTASILFYPFLDTPLYSYVHSIFKIWMYIHKELSPNRSNPHDTIYNKKGKNFDQRMLCTHLYSLTVYKKGVLNSGTLEFPLIGIKSGKLSL